MAKLIYSMLTSLDGYTEDEHGRFGWGAPEDEEVALLHQRAWLFIRHLSLRAEDVRDDGVLGDGAHGARSTAVRARLCEAVAGGGEDRTLAEPRRTRTRIEREFDPGAVRRLKANAERDVTVDGPELAAQAIRAGLVDEFQMIVCPVIVGGGKRFFPDGCGWILISSRSDALIRE
jgi:RibD C-terminal domain